MKQLLLFAFLFALPSLRAQQNFSLSPNPVYGTEKEPYEIEAAATIKNLSTTQETFRWTRTVIQLENDSTCQTQVTDPYLHWFHAVSEKTFLLEPGQEGPMNVTLWDFEESGCCAIVHMKLKKLTGAPDSIEAFYYLRTCQPLDVSTIEKPSIKLYPNPVAQYFSLQNAESVHQMTLCDATGRLLRRIPANAENRYGIQNLPFGSYYLVLENMDGGILQVLEFVKG